MHCEDAHEEVKQLEKSIKGVLEKYLSHKLQPELFNENKTYKQNIEYGSYNIPQGYLYLLWTKTLNHKMMYAGRHLTCEDLNQYKSISDLEINDVTECPEVYQTRTLGCLYSEFLCNKKPELLQLILSTNKFPAFVVNILTAQLNAVLYAPGQPGAIIAANHFHSLRAEQDHKATFCTKKSKRDTSLDEDE